MTSFNEKGKTENCQNFPVFKKNIKVKEESWRVIEPQAIQMGLDRLVRKVKGEDSLAREANCHKTCFKDFHLKYLNYLKAEEKKEERHSEAQSDSTTTHDYAFSVTLNVLSKRVIQKKHLITLSELRLVYVSKLENQGCANASYREEKLLSKLENCELRAFLSFSLIKKSGSIIIDYIIYNAKLSIGDAVLASYKFGYTNGSSPKKAAASLRDFITAEYAKSKPLPWPPTVDDLESKHLCDCV